MSSPGRSACPTPRGLGTRSHDVKGNAKRAFPWSGDVRGEDKTKIWKYLTEHPAGAPLPLIVEHLFGVDSDGDSQAYQREYRFTKRFVESAPVFEIDSRQDLLHVAPLPAAFHLTSPKQRSNTDAVGRSSDQAEQPDQPQIVEQDAAAIEVDERPREFARRFLDSRGCRKMTASRAQLLERQFAAYREQIEGRWNILKNIRDQHPEYLLVPYSTLYNSERRVADNWRRYHSAWTEATRKYSVGVQVCLTTDPKRFESLQEMADATSENFNRFMSWATRRLADRCDGLGTEGHNLRECPHCEEYGERPDFIKVLEWTDAGRPHLHVIFFGIDWLAPQQEIARQWGRHQARVVDVRTVRKQPVRNGDGIEVGGHEFEWMSMGDETTRSKNEKAHMGKYLGEQMPASESISEIRERVEDPDDDLWKTAMFWATGKQFWSCSEDLKTDDGGEDDLADLREYVHVGAAKDGDIPAHVWSSSVKLRGIARGKDPPD